MKKIFVVLLCVFALVSCQNNTCTIQGIVKDSSLNGKHIFLVPILNDTIGVDSVVIVDNKFKFECNKEYLADIRVDYHFRYGKESLLVITEPGSIDVVIDSVSTGKGTPQNDSLQIWKEMLMKTNKDIQLLKQQYIVFMNNGDTLKAEISKKNIEIIADQFNKRTKKMSDNLKSGTLYDFLIQRVAK